MVHPLIPLFVPGASCSLRLPVGYRTPPDRGIDSRGPSGMGWGCSHGVGGTPRGGDVAISQLASKLNWASQPP